MSDYTPTFEEVKCAVDEWMWAKKNWSEPHMNPDWKEFDRFIRKVMAEAWNEGYEAGSNDELAHERGVTMNQLSQYTSNPYEVGE